MLLGNDRKEDHRRNDERQWHEDDDRICVIFHGRSSCSLKCRSGRAAKRKDAWKGDGLQKLNKTSSLTLYKKNNTFEDHLYLKIHPEGGCKL